MTIGPATCRLLGFSLVYDDAATTDGCARIGVVSSLQAHDLVVVDSDTTALVPDLDAEQVHVGAGRQFGVDSGE
jgi:hypothetical protein